MPRRAARGPSCTPCSAQERPVRCQAAQRVADQGLLRGSLVRMRRACGKKNCRCQQGWKHPALHLAIRCGGRRRMIYLPPALEETVRRWVKTSREVEELVEAISQHCLGRLLAKKRETLDPPGLWTAAE
jgi:hypothetical protein